MNITTSSDLIKQLQPILLHPEFNNHDSSALDEEITNTKLLKCKNNETIPLKTSLIIEYILTYMQSQGSMDNEDIETASFTTNTMDLDYDDESSLNNENEDTFNIVSELDNDLNNPTKLRKMLVFLAKSIRQISENLENRDKLMLLKTPNSSRHSKLALLDTVNDKEMITDDFSGYERLISFLISECVVNNIKLHSTQDNNEDACTMLENSIKELIQMVSNKQEDHDVVDKGMVNSTVNDDDLKLKLEDLQLAHDFLSEKFSKERLHYNNNITIKEKQISNLTKQLKEKNLEIKKLNDIVDDLKSKNNNKPITPYSEDHENFNHIINSPSSISSNNSESINVLKTEFKSQLNKMRDYYESELDKLRS
ncbi:hypothetical protein ACO0R3_002710 [Hanseniaspora guilliermondii]